MSAADQFSVADGHVVVIRCPLAGGTLGAGHRLDVGGARSTVVDAGTRAAREVRQETAGDRTHEQAGDGEQEKVGFR